MCRPVWLTRQVVSRPTLAGKLRDGQRPLFQCGCRHRSCTFESNERAVARYCQKLRIHQGAEERVAHIPFEPPEALGLRGSQAESRHLDVLTLYSLECFIDAHARPPTRATRNLLLFAWLKATCVPAPIRRVFGPRLGSIFPYKCLYKNALHSCVPVYGQLGLCRVPRRNNHVTVALAVWNRYGGSGAGSDRARQVLGRVLSEDLSTVTVELNR